MTPYYEEDGITIYHGDLRDVLPSLSFTAILTDPPYGNGTDYPSHVDTQEALVDLVDVLRPHLLATKRSAVTCGVGNMYRFPPPRWTLCWFDPGGTGSGPWGFCTWQPVLVYGTDPYLAAGMGRRPDGRYFMLGRRPHKEDQDGSGGHPCPKPLDVANWLVARTSAPTDVLCDPFTGSGTFLVAAKSQGRQAIGIELEERYCEIAAKRLAQGVLALEPG